MKQAKMLLSGIALFAVVGGAFAFKAHKFSSVAIWTASSPNACARVTNLTTTNVVTTKTAYFTLAGPATGTTTCTTTTYLTVPVID